MNAVKCSYTPSCGLLVAPPCAENWRHTYRWATVRGYRLIRAFSPSFMAECLGGPWSPSRSW